MDLINYESPMYREENPKDCKKCGLHVKRAVAVCWDLYGVCPVCFNKESFECGDTLIQADAIVIRKNPMDFYLDQYTHTELENVS